MILTVKEFSLKSINEMSPEKQDDLYRSYVALGKKSKTSKDEHREGALVMGKALCLLEERLNAGVKARVFAANKSLKELFKDITGETPLTHALTLKNAFGAFVQTGRITEQDYDFNSGNCLEIAARIATEVKGNLEHDAVKLAAAELVQRSKKEAENLRAILASIKPAKKLTPLEALEMIKAIAADGQLAVVIAEMPDIIKEMPETDQRDIYQTMSTAGENLDTILGDKIDAWIKERETATKAPELKTSESPAPEASAPVENEEALQPV